MKNRGQAFLKRAALGAAFFFVAGPALAAEEKPALKAANARVQRLFDQAVKLHRRHAENPKAPLEPFRSILTELSLYHEGETATYLSDIGAEGTRGGPVHFAPWALRRLALLSMRQGAYAEAALQFGELRERFAGAQVVEPADGVMASAEKVEASALRGEIEAVLALAGQEGGKQVAEGLESRIELLQENFGAEALPGHESPGSYSEFSMNALWKALALDKADFKRWQKLTLAFAKREKTEALKKSILESLAEGCFKLGKKEEAEKHLKNASTLKSAGEGKRLQGLFSNLIK